MDQHTIDPQPAHLEAVRVLARHGRFIAVLSLSAMLFALALTYIFSEKYQSGVAVFYRQAEVTLMRPQDQQAFGSPSPKTPFKVISKTVEEIVNSETVLRPVVLELKLHVSETSYQGPWYRQLYEQAKDTLREWRDKVVSFLKYGRVIDDDPVFAAIKSLRKNIEVINKDSFVFKILVRDKHPERAAAIADRVAQGLVEFLRREFRQIGRQRERQLAEMMSAKEAEMRGLQDQIQAIYRRHNLASVRGERDRSIERWSSLELSRVELDSRIEQDREKLRTIKARLERQAGAQSSYIQPEDKRKMESERLFTEVELRGLEAERESLARSLGELRNRLGELPAVELELEQLETALEGVKRDWVQLRDTRQEASLRAGQPVSEAQILHAATVPTSPTSPIKAYHVALAGTLALLLGSGLAFVFDFFGVRAFQNRRRSARGERDELSEDSGREETGELLPARLASRRSPPVGLLAASDAQMARFAEDVFEALVRKRLLDELDLARESQERLARRRELRRQVEQ